MKNHITEEEWISIAIEGDNPRETPEALHALGFRTAREWAEILGRSRDYIITMSKRKGWDRRNGYMIRDDGRNNPCPYYRPLPTTKRTVGCSKKQLNGRASTLPAANKSKRSLAPPVSATLTD